MITMYQVYYRDNYEGEYSYLGDALDALGLIVDQYDECLNECYGEVNICGYDYDANQALYKVDPVAYRCGYLDYLSSVSQDYESMFEEDDKGDEVLELDDYTIVKVYKNEKSV